MLLNNRDHWRNQRGNKNIPRGKWQWKHYNPNPMGHCKNNPEREIYNNKILPQETRKISNKLPKITPKAIRERRNKTQT